LLTHGLASVSPITSREGTHYELVSGGKFKNIFLRWFRLVVKYKNMKLAIGSPEQLS
jgi:hypothetical protein